MRNRPGPVRRRRSLLQLAALGLGGWALACDRYRDPPTTARDGGGARTGPDTRTPQVAGPSTTPAGAAPTSPPRIAGAEPQCLVTKQHGLPAAYVPADLMPLPSRLLASSGVRLRGTAAEAVVRLIDAAALDGHQLFVLSGFRSYEEQESVLRNEIALYGKAVAEKQVAPPGHSEHQLGLAVDITSAAAPYDLRPEFGREPEGRWLADNAARFGFAISYPQGKEQVTGYVYEPWHIRYVGKAIAEELSASGLTLTEFLPKYDLAGGCP
jgi:LAS superfamily LD-carboxypeptidase LdcB